MTEMQLTVELTFVGAGLWDGGDVFPFGDVPMPRIPVIGETIIGPDDMGAWKVSNVAFDYPHGFNPISGPRLTARSVGLSGAARISQNWRQGVSLPSQSSPFPSPAEDQGEPLVSVAMTREAAEKFLAAVGYGAAVAEAQAERSTPAMRDKITEHAEWLRWGQARVGALIR